MPTCRGTLEFYMKAPRYDSPFSNFIGIKKFKIAHRKTKCNISTVTYKQDDLSLYQILNI